MSKEIGERIKKARKELRMSQEALGGGLYTKSYICQLEKGKTRPSLKALQHISEKLNKPISYFCAEPEITEHITEEANNDKEIGFLISVARNMISKGEYGSALELIKKAEKIELESHTQYNEALIHRYKGLANMYLHEWEEAESNFEKALEYYFKRKEMSEVVNIYLNLAQMGVFKQDINQARKYFRKAKHWTKKYEINDESILLDIQRGYGTLFWIDGDITRALRSYRKALKYAEKIAEPEKLGEIYVNLGLALKDSNEIDKALEVSNKAMGMFDIVQNQKKIAHVGVNLGIIYLEKGSKEKSLRFLNQSYGIYDKLGDWKSKADTLTEIAKVYIAKGELDIASKKARTALALSEEFGDEVEKARILSVMAQIALKGNDYKKAKELYKECIGILEKHEVNVELAKAMAEYSELLIRNKKGTTEKKENLFLEQAIEKLRKSFK